jgi:HK97 gp10 family phage protein
VVKNDKQKVGSMQLVGAVELKKLLDAYPKLVAASAVRKGLRVAARDLQKVIQNAAPRKTGMLRSAIRIARSRTRDKNTYRYKVGLGPIRGDIGLAAKLERVGDINAGRKPKRVKSKTRFYYKTLEFGREGGPPLHPFFLNAYNSARSETAQKIIEETKKAVYTEAARINRRSLSLKKRG